MCVNLDYKCLCDFALLEHDGEHIQNHFIFYDCGIKFICEFECGFYYLKTKILLSFFSMLKICFLFAIYIDSI